MISPFQYLPYSKMFPLEQVIHEDRSYQKGRLTRKQRPIAEGQRLGEEERKIPLLYIGNEILVNILRVILARVPIAITFARVLRFVSSTLLQKPRCRNSGQPSKQDYPRFHRCTFGY